MITRRKGLIWSLCGAGLAGCVIGYVLRKAAQEQRRAEAKFTEEAIKAFENEGGLVPQ